MLEWRASVPPIGGTSKPGVRGVICRSPHTIYLPARCGYPALEGREARELIELSANYQRRISGCNIVRTEIPIG